MYSLNYNWLPIFHCLFQITGQTFTNNLAFSAKFAGYGLTAVRPDKFSMEQYLKVTLDDGELLKDPVK